MKEQYLRSVGQLLDCPRRRKKRLLRLLDSAVSAYLADVPNAGVSELAANFGTPEECAAWLLEECDPASIAEAHRKKSLLRRMEIILFVILLAAAVGIAVYLWSTEGIFIINLCVGGPRFGACLPAV